MRLTPRQFAQRAKLDIETVYKRLKAGKFGSAARKSGRRWSIDWEAWRASEIAEDVPDSSRTPICTGLVVQAQCEEHPCGCRWGVVHFQSDADLVDWLAEVFEDALACCDDDDRKEAFVREAVQAAVDRVWPSEIAKPPHRQAIRAGDSGA